MLKPRITFAESAVRDLEDIRHWYTDQGVPEVGLRFVREVVGKVERLPTHPQKGRIVPEFGQTTLRELIQPPFRIVYRQDSSRIQVVRIWRSERLLKLAEPEE